LVAQPVECQRAHRAGCFRAQVAAQVAGPTSIGPDADPAARQAIQIQSTVERPGVEAAADWDSLWSPENYLGYERSEHFASANGVVLDTPHRYGAPAQLRLNHWALSGDWTVRREAIVLNQADGGIVYRFHARDLHLVMAPSTPGTPVRFGVRIDGQPPGAAHGGDVDDQGHGTLTQPRLYQLIRQPAPVSERTLEITFLDPGVRAYSFTFG
jgi:hypothetical protein